jgi:hypothetical protein
MVPENLQPLAPAVVASAMIEPFQPMSKLPDCVWKKVTLVGTICLGHLGPPERCPIATAALWSLYVRAARVRHEAREHIQVSERVIEAARQLKRRMQEFRAPV